MNIILKDGTQITDATVNDIQELVSRGIIHSDPTPSHEDSLLDAPWKSNKYYSDSLDSLIGENNELFNACKDLCKDNDLIPPEYHDGEPEIDGNSPGFNAIRNLIAEGKVVDCPSADFPQVNFEKQPDSWATTGMTACFPSTACCNISANNSVIHAEDIKEKDGGFAVIGHAILPVGNW